MNETVYAHGETTLVVAAGELIETSQPAGS